MNEAMSGLALVQSLHQPMPELGKTANFAVMDRKYMQAIQLAGLDHGANLANRILDCNRISRAMRLDDWRLQAKQYGPAISRSAHLLGNRSRGEHRTRVQPERIDRPLSHLGELRGLSLHDSADTIS